MEDNRTKLETLFEAHERIAKRCAQNEAEGKLAVGYEESLYEIEVMIEETVVSIHEKEE